MPNFFNLPIAIDVVMVVAFGAIGITGGLRRMAACGLGIALFGTLAGLDLVNIGAQHHHPDVGVWGQVVVALSGVLGGVLLGLAGNEFRTRRANRSAH